MGFLTIDYDYYKEIDEKTIRIFTLFNVLTVCAYSLRTKLFGQRSGRPTHRGSSASVSYTHLDVYKRQVQDVVIVPAEQGDAKR